MIMLELMHVVDERATPNATAADPFKTFTEERHSLYLLSLLLTADNDKAEQCFVSAMGECLEEIGVFMGGRVHGRGGQFSSVQSA
jgi:hypothetical protein